MYGLAHCNQPLVKGISIPREQASLLIVSLDVLILLLFSVGIARLRYYEEIFERDQQMQAPSIQDFSVYLNSIPIKPEDYNNDKDLLTSMITVSLEDILVNKFMEENGLSKDEAEDLCQVSSIHYGVNKHHSMSYLIGISERAKKIGVLRKKVNLDPKNTHSYESQQWVLYREITKLKEKYYEIRREDWQPQILNAYITFRDI